MNLVRPFRRTIVPSYEVTIDAVALEMALPLRSRTSVQRVLAIGLLAALCTSLAKQIQAQASNQDAAKNRVRVEGTVRGATGQPIRGATVHMREDDGRELPQAETDASGRFALSAQSGTHLSIFAENTGIHSPDLQLEPPEGGFCYGVVLVIGGTPESLSNCSKSNAQDMQFSDTPTFSIAAVTDWTAAGGHGSDSILRTSESLARDTIKLSSDRSDLSSSSRSTSADSSALESKYRHSLAIRPSDFEATFKLGDLLLQEGKSPEALPLLQAAHRMRQDDFAAELALARALKDAGQLAEAKQHIDKLMARSKTGDLLRLAGELDEQMGDSLTAVRLLEDAAHEDPNEENYFQWGTELLIHRAIWQAKDVFAAAVRRYPNSKRLATALGATLFACALYEDAATQLCHAADLPPASAEPYVFLGKAVIAAPDSLACAASKLAEFAGRESHNAIAQFYYAMAIWKQQGTADSQVQALLERTLALDPKCSDASLQMGNLWASRHDMEKAIGFYQDAIKSNPRLSEAHYKLGIALDRTGERDKAKLEFQLHDGLEAEEKAAVEQQRHEVKQFLVVQDKPAETRP